MNVSRETDREAGFTLAELVIATSLTVLILAMTFMVIQAMNRISVVQTNQAYFARNATVPLELMDKALVQNTLVSNTNSNGYAIDFETYNAAGGKDRYVFQALANGKLTQTRYSPYTSLTGRTSVLSDQNANYALSHPLFNYYSVDASGAPVTATVPSAARGVRIDLWVTSSGSSYNTSRVVSFRNQN